MTTHPFSSTPARAARLIVVALALMLATAALISPLVASAEVPHGPTATITVDGTTCTLADAITAANTNSATGGCTAGSGADTIDLQVDVNLTSALPSISSVITINGNGHTIARNSGAPQFRILDVTSSGNLAVNETTITGGNLIGDGGGINVVGGSLALTRSIIENNQANPTTNDLGKGGGIRFEGAGTLSIIDSTIRNNVANGSGAGGGLIYDINGAGTPAAPVTISGSTFSGNSTTDSFADGGGIQISSDPTGETVFNINNSTFSGNSTIALGGGIAIIGGNVSNAVSTLNINSSTFTGNTADPSLSVDNSGPDIAANIGNPLDPTIRVNVNLKNTILASGCGNYFGPNAAVFTSLGHNLSSVAAGTSCVLTQPTDLPNTNPQLDALANNGGPTWTHALLTGSPAINAGDTALPTDQRGQPRPTGAADDIGAYEEQNPLAITLASFDAAVQADHVLVIWETVSEMENAGFNLYRTATADRPTAANLLAFVPSQGPGSTQGFAYSHQDYAVTAGQTYWYWLEDVDLNGATTLHGPVSVVFTAPTAVTLSGLAASSPTPLAALWWLMAVATALAAAAAVVWRRRTTI